MTERTNNIPTIQQASQEFKDNIAKLRNDIKAQFESDMEHLKLYANEEGTERLTALGNMDKLCERLMLTVELIEESLLQAIIASKRLEVMK